MSGSLPDGACDAHCHVFGPAARFPFAANRTYTPADAIQEALAALHDRLGIDRAIIVQPAAHGFDNAALLDAISAAPGRRRGVALLPEDVTDEAVQALHGGGIRAVRFNFMPHLSAVPTVGGFRRIADRIAPFGWHIVVHIGADSLALLARYLDQTDLPVIIDHMARIPAQGGVGQDAFRELLGLLGDPRIWVKISGADRCSATAAPFDDTLPLMQALVKAAPDRILWGTDWPHPNLKGPLPQEEDLVALLVRAVPDPGTLERILVQNPNRLYGFEPCRNGSTG